MAVTSAAFAVSTTPVLLTGATVSGTSVQSFAVSNNDTTATVYIGGFTVTSVSGLPLPAGSVVTIDLANVVDELYAVAASGTVDVRVLGTFQ